MYEKRFSVWVGGSEVNEYLLTKENADAIAAVWRANGYDDVVVDEVKTKRKYEIAVKEDSYGIVTVEADSVEQAYEKANEAYGNGQINWTGGSFKVLSIKNIVEL